MARGFCNLWVTFRNEEEIPRRDVCPDEKKHTTRRPRSRLGVIRCVHGEHSQYLPGVLEATQWTLRSPVSGMDSTLRSVGGDKAVRGGKQTMNECGNAALILNYCGMGIIVLSGITKSCTIAVSQLKK